MCQLHSAADVRATRKRRLFCKQEFGPEEERAFEWFLDSYRDALDPVESDIAAWVDGASEDDLASLESIRADLESRVGEYTGDFEVVFREGGERGAEAGRAMAARQHQLDIAFDVVPERTLDIIDDWVEEAAGSTLDTITEDSARWLRGAHEGGLDVDTIADQLNDELFEGRLEGHVAERASRTGVISTSNAGNHSAIEDSTAIGEEWITEIDGRQRESHEEANGQIVPVDGTFLVGGVYLDHPSDPTAPLEAIVNCRCSLAPVWPEDLTEDELDALQSGERLKAVTGPEKLRKLMPDGTTEALAA